MHYYKMWVQFISLRSLDQWIHWFFVGPCSLQLVNSLKIQWNHLAYKDAFCCNDEYIQSILLVWWPSSWRPFASNQIIFIFDSSVKRRCNRICGVRSLSNHYRKSRCKDIMFVANHNHKFAHDAFYRSGKPLHSNASPECIHAKGRFENFPTQREVCCPISGVDSSDLTHGDSWNIC